MNKIKCERQVKSPYTYIEDIEAEHNIEDIVVEHRSNNAKRDFLFVNKSQCKHIPNSPTKMLEMCNKLASEVRVTIKDSCTSSDNVLIVGFAETATAIGEFVAENLHYTTITNVYLTQTTRESVNETKEILNFEEEHSHATTHKLLERSNESIDLNMFKYILFVEDEITTGNTILNFVNAMREQFDGMKNTGFGVASICNWQDLNEARKFERNCIDTFCLIHGELHDLSVKMLDHTYLRVVEQERVIKEPKPYIKKLEYPYECQYQLRPNNFVEQRTINKFDDICEEKYSRFNDEFTTELAEYIHNTLKANSYRIIGTEEFMGLPIRVGQELESLGAMVICQATTRSKIDVLNTKYDGESSGIKKRYQVPSAYDYDRENYIYNLSEYTHAVVIISDTPDEYKLSMLALAIGELVSTSKIAYIKL